MDSDLGITRIEGETVESTLLLGIPEMLQFPVFYEGSARYRWDGEERYRMLETLVDAGQGRLRVGTRKWTSPRCSASSATESD
jgi:hypothetical protein